MGEPYKMEGYETKIEAAKCEDKKEDLCEAGIKLLIWIPN